MSLTRPTSWIPAVALAGLALGACTAETKPDKSQTTASSAEVPKTEATSKPTAATATAAAATWIVYTLPG